MHNFNHYTVILYTKRLLIFMAYESLNTKITDDLQFDQYLLKELNK